MTADLWRILEAHEEAGRYVQVPACDRCSQGVLDRLNIHSLGLCICPCHDKKEEA